MKIRDILRTKGHEVVTIEEDRSVLEAAATLVRHNIGSLLIVDGDHPKGIITERDILRWTARAPTDLGAITVGSVMTHEPIVAEPDDDLHVMMRVMTERRIRHLPVVEDERLRGIVSIGDLLDACWNLAENENVQLRHYIHGGA